MSQLPLEVSPSKPALATVMQFLKNQNLRETEEALRKELGLATSVSSSQTLQAGGLQSSSIEPSKITELYVSLLEFVEKSLDMYRHELTLVLYPIFVHLYLVLVQSGQEHYARQFYQQHHLKQESYYNEELTRLHSITTMEQMGQNDLIEIYRKNKFSLRMSNDSLQSLLKHLQVNQHTVILDIINRHIQIDVFDGTPRTQGDILKTMGSMLGEAALKLNKTKILYGIPRDADVAAALAEMEQAESLMEEDRPKKKKPKKDTASGKKGKTVATPNAPSLTRIPLPPLRDCEQAAKFQAFKDTAKCISLSYTVLPSICCYTLLNTSSGLNSVTLSDDSSLLAGGFNDSIVRVWALTPRKLYSMKSPAQMQHMPLSAEDITERILDVSSAADMRTLVGHSGPVYSTSFNPDNTLLLSGSEDGTVRLWSLQTFTALVCYKGHNYPVWSVEFSPMGFYFISGSHDRSARLWSTDHVHPLRIFAGHCSDIDCCRFHPNGNYIVTASSDRSVRMWDILNGQCVRIFTGHKGSIYALVFSMDGKYLASGGADRSILIWDIGAGSQIHKYTGHSDTICQLAFSRDGTLLASGGMDNCVKLWDTSVLEDKTDQPQDCLVGSYPTKSTPIHCLHFTRKNLLLTAGPFNN